MKAVAKKVTPKQEGKFRLTYATMFNPPEKMHTDFDKAVAKFRAEMGKDVPMLINGEDRFIEAKFEDRSPINTEWLLGTFQKGGVAEGQEALAAAKAAAPKWAATEVAGSREDSAPRGRADREAPVRNRRGRGAWRSARTAWKRWATCRKPPI